MRCTLWDLGVSLPLCYSHLFASYNLLRIFVLILLLTHSSSHEWKKGWQSLYIQIQLFHLANNFFFGKSMFSDDGLKCHPKRRKQFFFWENMDFSKKLVCYFARLNFNIFLKQRCMNVRYFELTWLYASI